MAPNIRPLSPELQERAKKELNEVPERVESDIAAIRDWLKKQPHILGKPDDQMIVSFLRGCKFSLERTKEKIDLYYTMRTALPEFFKDRDIKDPILREILELAWLFPLGGCDEKGRPVAMMRAGLGDPNRHKMEKIFMTNFMMQDYSLKEDDHAIITGVVNVMDMEKLSLVHIAQMNPSFVKKAQACSQDAYPFRPKGLNFINTPGIFDAIFNLFNSFSKEKIQRRTYVHGSNLEALYKNVPQKLLPTEYGGMAGTVKELNDAWIAKLDSLADWYSSPEGTLGVDESKRPGKPKTHQDLFGLEGSFRQLNFD